MLAILAPILVFGLIIFVHELGHFLAAKSLGVYAPRFSIGFGPALWRRRFGETEYVLSAFPLGGFVRMASRLDADIIGLEGGSEEDAKRREDEPGYDAEAMLPFGPKPVPEDRLFESKPLWARLIILLAGVTMNGVLALVVLVALAMQFGSVVVPTRVVGTVRPVKGAPVLAQLSPGDTIVAVNGSAVSNWNELYDRIAQSDSVVRIRTTRASVAIPVNGAGQPSADDVAGAIDFHVPPVLDSVIAGGAAAKAGLVRGDRVLSIDGHPVRDWSDLVALVSAAPGRGLAFVVQRGGAVDSIAVTPRGEEGPDGATVGKIGAAVADPSIHTPIGVGRAFTAGARATWVMIDQTATFLGRMVTGHVAMKQLGGPVAITKASVAAARTGLESLFTLIAFLSINVAIFNLLPIPIMDGGQVLINVAESVKGSPLTLRTRERLAQLGLAAVGVLLLLVMYNDTRAWFAQAFHWVTGLFG